MKIDFHCHTRKVKDGDPQTREVLPELFAKKIADADVSVVAITNHNLFDIDQYKILKEKVASYCQVWPGIELDIVDESNCRWHMVVVANPNHAEDFYEKTKQLLGNQDKNTVSFDINTVVSSLGRFDSIFIPHYHIKPGDTVTWLLF